MAWRQLRQLDKPIALLDAAGYFTPWLQALEHAAGEGFVDRFEIERLIVDARPAAVLAAVLAGIAAQGSIR
jgi:predicted Rossmann-fold nucleotide-binding protein